MKYANITPITIIYNKPEATKLYVSITSDNLTNQATFMATLYAGNGANLLNQQVDCGGEEYLGWNGDNDFPFSFCAENLGVEIIDFGDDTPVEVPVEEVIETPLEEEITEE